jgi:uncharacterized protein YlaI
MEYVEAKCMMCGKIYSLGEDNKDFKKISDKEKPGTYICDLCANRVRYESEDKKKSPKPQNN